MDSIFKKCPCCNEEWTTQELFLGDRNLEIVGYKADFKKLEYGLFFFNHQIPNCNSTITIETNMFFNLYSGKKYTERKTGSEDCKGYCKNLNQLSRCDALCECAFVREILRIIRNRENT